MGGAIAKNSERRRMARDRLRHRAKALRRSEGRRASRLAAMRRGRGKADEHPRQPAEPEALTATVERIADAQLPRRVIAELSTFALDDKAEPSARCAKPATCCSIVP
jgi:hypothetical protein